MPFQWTHPEFRFRSSRDWEQIETDDASRLQLVCRETATTLTLSMDPYAIPPAKFESTARFLLDARKQAYVDGVRHLSGPKTIVDLTYSYETVRPHSTGTGYEIAYEAVARGRSFLGYLGYVTSRKVVNLFVDTAVSFTPGRKDMFREVVAGFDVTLP